MQMTVAANIMRFLSLHMKGFACVASAEMISGKQPNDYVKEESCLTVAEKEWVCVWNVVYG